MLHCNIAMMKAHHRIAIVRITRVRSQSERRIYWRARATSPRAYLSFAADTYFKSDGDSIEFCVAVRALRIARQNNCLRFSPLLLLSGY